MEFVPMGGSCAVDLEFTCTTGGGRGCDSIRTPSSRTCDLGEPISVIQFSYQNTGCDRSSNNQGDRASCTDEAPLVSNQVQVACFDEIGASVAVSPTTVSPNGSFTVTAIEGSLPGAIGCSIASLDGTVIQRSNFDVSGGIPLELGDSFGALKVEGCSEMACRSVVTYTTLLQNPGLVAFDVTRLELVFIGEVFNLAEGILQESIAPGQTASIEETFEIDICSGGTILAGIDVEVASLSGEICQDAEQFFFTVSPLPQPTPRTTCGTDVSLTCGLEDGTDCAAAVVRSLDCEARLVYRIQVCNSGQVELEVTGAEFSVNGNVVPFVDQLQNPIPTGECTVVTPAIDVDLCDTLDLNVLASVVGNPPNGNQCQDEEQLRITIAPSPP